MPTQHVLFHFSMANDISDETVAQRGLVSHTIRFLSCRLIFQTGEKHPEVFGDSLHNQQRMLFLFYIIRLFNQTIKIYTHMTPSLTRSDIDMYPIYTCENKNNTVYSIIT